MSLTCGLLFLFAFVCYRLLCVRLFVDLVCWMFLFVRLIVFMSVCVCLGLLVVACVRLCLLGFVCSFVFVLACLRVFVCVCAWLHLDGGGVWFVVVVHVRAQPLFVCPHLRFACVYLSLVVCVLLLWFVCALFVIVC